MSALSPIQMAPIGISARLEEPNPPILPGAIAAIEQANAPSQARVSSDRFNPLDRNEIQQLIQQIEQSYKCSKKGIITVVAASVCTLVAGLLSLPFQAIIDPPSKERNYRYAFPLVLSGAGGATLAACLGGKYLGYLNTKIKALRALNEDIEFKNYFRENVPEGLSLSTGIEIVVATYKTFKQLQRHSERIRNGSRYSELPAF